MTKPRRQPEPQPGYDGAVMSTVRVRVTATRSEPRALRCRPGTFEWRYNRDDTTLNPLYLAGVQFADLWERAGTADARAIDYSQAGGGGTGWRGVPDGRTMAMDTLRGVFREVGKLPCTRLQAYCVDGLTAAETAARYDINDRTMAALLHEDLRAVAMHFRFL